MAAADIDWSKVSEPIAREVLSQGEKHLQAQLSAALAADQRALTLAGVLLGISTAIFGASFGYWTSNGDAPLLLAGTVTGLLMLSGALCCVWSARPVDLYFPGNHPEQWWGVLDGKLSAVLGIESENYQEMITDNAAVLSDNCKWLERGLILSSLAPVVGSISWFLGLLFFPVVASPAHAAIACLALA